MQKIFLEEKLKRIFPNITIIDSIHKKIPKLDSEKKEIKNKNGTTKQISIIDKENYSKLTHCIVFQTKQISYLTKICNQYFFNIILDTTIDFDKLSQNNPSININHTNLINNINSPKML